MCKLTVEPPEFRSTCPVQSMVISSPSAGSRFMLPEQEGIVSKFQRGQIPLKIAKIEQFQPKHPTRLIKITTDAGIVGWGETTLEGKPKSTWAAVEELLGYLVGKDPLRIEHHWQYIYRSAFFRGAVS